MTIREYTIQLLKDYNCELNCYAELRYWNGQELHSGYEDAYKDLQAAAEQDGKSYPFSIEAIARELVSIGNEQPLPPRKGHKKYCMIFDTDSDCAGVEFDDFEAAKSDMIDTYINWAVEEMRDWTTNAKGELNPTEEQIENYDYMIDNCCCYIVEWDDELDDYEDSDNAYWLPQQELDEIGYIEWIHLKEKLKAL